ncbi:MAG: tetratricopeptide repeat protein [Spirochaetaceae bacterium]|nr:tetratricopeptide repeat protein [Spirochaetaceae bacterium]
MQNFHIAKKTCGGMRKGMIWAALLCAALMAACSSVPKTAREDGFIGRVYAKLSVGDLNGALSLFDTLSPEDAAKSGNLLAKASILYSLARYDDAVIAAENAQQAAKTTREKIEAVFITANIEGAKGNMARQKTLLESILKEDGVFVPALNKLGDLAMSADQYKNAISYYDRALAVEPKNLDALIGSAESLRFMRKPKEAFAKLSEAIASHPDSAQAYALRGRVLRESERLEDSLSDLDAAKKLDPKDYWIAYDRGRTLLALYRKKEALEEFERAEKNNPSIFVSYVYSAGIRDDLGDHKKAMHDYETLIKLKPDYFFALEMLGVHYMREKRFAEAREAFKAAFARSPQSYNYALLAVINGLYAGDQHSQYKPFIEETMRKIERTKPEYSILRMFYDFSGEADVSRRTSTEKDSRIKASNLFYLASYYDVRGASGLAEKYFAEYKDLQRRDTTEWRIFEWVKENG